MGCFMDVEGLDEAMVAVDQQPLSLHPDHLWLTTGPMMLKMKQKLFSWSGDDYTVYWYNPTVAGNKNGTPLLKIDGKAAAWNSLMHIKDLNGQLMAILDGKTQFGGYTKFELQNPQKQCMAVITRDFEFGKVSVSVKSPDETRLYYTANGTFWEHRFVVRNRNGQIVGKSSRQMTNSGLHSYGVQMCRGFDYLLMVLLMAAVDEYEDQEKNK
mmetsp:Transcript_43681/g.72145  ORF Transcript_43681/g.72145 Transcript_43681/m.72145 type:complete len:212 (-) Transcript_43681:126-761(-)